MRRPLRGARLLPCRESGETDMPDAAHMTALLNHYGYLAVLAGTFLEGETVLLVAGALAREGYMSLFWVGLSAFMGGLGSDQLMFALGRRYGPAFLAKRPRLRRAAERLAPFLRRHDAAFILGVRFAYGLRGVAPMLAGIQGVSPRRFLALNALGALIWAVIFSLAGYFMGAALEMAFGRLDANHPFALIGAALIAVAGAVLGARWWWSGHPPKK